MTGGDVASSAHHPVDINSVFRKFLAAFAADQYAILPMAIVALVGAGALYTLDPTMVPTDEIWELHSVNVVVTDPAVTGVRQADVQLMEGKLTMGSTGQIQLGNGSNTLLTITAVGSGWGNWTAVSDSLAIANGVSLNKQWQANIPYTQFMNNSVITLGVNFSGATVTIVTAVAIIRRRRRKQPIEVYQ